MAVGTWQDVAVALGRPTSSVTTEQQAQWEWWLVGVESIIGFRLGDVSELDQDMLLYVEVEVVAAKATRGSSTVESETVSTDDSSYTTRYQSVTQADILDEWWSLLTTSISTGAYSTRPGFEADTVGWSVSTPPAWRGQYGNTSVSDFNS